MTSKNTRHGIKTFTIIWLGQLVSLVGSGLTGFALGIWTFERTGSATQFALIGLSAILPRVVLSPLAGAVVDRWNRRWVMIVSDVGAGLSTLVVVLLLFADQLDIWHIYLLASVNAAFGTIQWPAYMAATSHLVPKKHLGRANGMLQFAHAASEILSPALAGALVGIIRLEGVILIDVITFLFAVVTLLGVQIPQPDVTAPSGAGGPSLRNQITFGWAYISARPGLRNLLLFFAAVNFLWAMVGALITPMILSWASSQVLGAILSIAGIGMFAGSVVMSVWGGPIPRINGVLYFEQLSGICFVLMGLFPSFWPIAVGAFGAHVTIAIVFGSNQAIWQTKVSPEVQGRVFATQQMVTRATSPLAYLLAGPLADVVFEPLLAADGPLSNSVGQLLGAGPGRGIGLLFVLMGLTKILFALVGQSNPRIRRVEAELPDAVFG
jgi:MFS family permease